MRWLNKNWVLATYLISAASLAFIKGFFTRINLPIELKILESYAFFTERLTVSSFLFSKHFDGVPRTTLHAIAIILCLIVTIEFLYQLSPNLPHRTLTREETPNIPIENRPFLRSAAVLTHLKKIIAVTIAISLTIDLFQRFEFVLMIWMIIFPIMITVFKSTPNDKVTAVFKEYIICIAIFLVPGYFYYLGRLHAEESKEKAFDTFQPVCATKKSDGELTCGQLLIYFENKSCIWSPENEKAKCFTQSDYNIDVHDYIAY